MKRMERDRAFGSGGRRFGAGEHESSDAYKVRKGKVGGYQDYFTDEQLEQIDRLISTSLVAGYGYTPGRAR
jgi:hypothetical protein